MSCHLACLSVASHWPLNRSRRVPIGRLLVCCLTASLLGCGGSNESTDSSQTASTAQASTAKDTQDAADDPPIEVPDGTPDELFAFMEQMETEQLGASEDDEVAAGEADSGDGAAENDAQVRAIRRVMRTRVAACDKILQRDVPEDTRLKAIRYKLDALRTLAAIVPADWQKPLEEYADQLRAGSDGFLRRMADATMFQDQVNDFLSEGAADPDTILQALDKLLANEQAGPETLSATRDAFGWLFQNGNVELAADGFRRIGQRFQSHEDATVSEEADSLLSQAINIRLTQLAKSAMEGDASALQKLLDEMKLLLQPENNDPRILAFAMQTAQFLEFSGHYAEARDAYRLIAERFGKASEDDPGLADNVKRSVELAERRLDLIGKPVKIEGIRLGGRSFDWSEYQGKWVVVAFWTTWHNDWQAELQNINAAIGPFRDPPVEVVTISLDDDRNALEIYLKETPSPWPVVVNPDPLAAGFENANAVRCGVEAVPFIMLVDPQGNVVDIHLLGSRLAEALNRALASAR